MKILIKKIASGFVLMTTFFLMSNANLYAQERIRFAKGRSSATVTGTIPANSNKFFLVGARAGQMAVVSVSPSNLKIFSNAASKGEAGRSDFETSDGDNEFGIYNPTNRLVKYTLTISIR